MAQRGRHGDQVFIRLGAETLGVPGEALEYFSPKTQMTWVLVQKACSVSLRLRVLC